MQDAINAGRRKLLKLGAMGAVGVAGLALSGRACATQNPGQRIDLRFQDHPNGEKQCNKCVTFLPNKYRAKNPGPIHGCKLYPGDTEIPSNGYCIGFVAKARK